MELPRTPSTRLDGRRALVTGAGRGIGLACAAALAQAGAHVVLVARTTSEVEEVAQAIRRDGGTAEAITLDITELDALNEVIAGLEPFDILVNNAGTNRASDVPRSSGERFRLHGLAEPAGGVLHRASCRTPNGGVRQAWLDHQYIVGYGLGWRPQIVRSTVQTQAWYGRYDQSHGNRSRPPRGFASTRSARLSSRRHWLVVFWRMKRSVAGS